MDEACFVGIADLLRDRPPKSLDDFIPEELLEVIQIWLLTKNILHDLLEWLGYSTVLYHCLVFLGVMYEAEKHCLIPVKEILWELIAIYDGATNSYKLFSRREKVLVSFTRGWFYPMEVLFTVHFYILLFNFFSECPKNHFKEWNGFSSQGITVIEIGFSRLWW